MIYEYIKNTIEQSDWLKDKVFPASMLLDEAKLPCAVYYMGNQTYEADLGGNIHHYTDVADIHLLGFSYDELHQIYREVEGYFRGSSQSESGSGEYIFGVEVSSPESDAKDLDLDIMRRVMRVTIDWCPMDE